MNVKKLRDFLAKLPDDTLVVLPSSDHSYSKVWSACTADAEVGPRGGLSEYYEGVSDESAKITVVVLS